MKRLSILLGITLAFTAPLAAHAESTALVADTTVPQAKPKAERVVVKAPAPRKAPRVWYEVTNITAVGSHLPVVICHRGKLMYVLGNANALQEYRREGTTDASGAEDAAGIVVGLNPAILPGVASGFRH